MPAKPPPAAKTGRRRRRGPEPARPVAGWPSRLTALAVWSAVLFFFLPARPTGGSAPVRAERVQPGPRRSRDRDREEDRQLPPVKASRSLVPDDEPSTPSGRQPRRADLPREEEPDEEYTRVEVRGKLDVRGAAHAREYGVVSQGRLWKLELGRDKVLLFIAPQLNGKAVLVTGRMRITEGKLDTLLVSRIEPVELPREK
jgi:hypothetical protein